MVSVDALVAGAETLPGRDSGTERLLSLAVLADPHVHLDKALTTELVANPAGDLAGAIEAWLAFRSGQTRDQIRERARRGSLAFLLSGATALRVHVDTGPDIGLPAVEALLDVRTELAGLLDLQVVACASLPVSGQAGREARALAAEALALGADVVGGAPYLDADPAAAYDELIRVALDAGTGLDLHVDETLAPGVFTLPLLIARVEGGFPHPVAVDHLVASPQPSPREDQVTCRSRR